MKILLLDLDGTIREPIEGQWVKGKNQRLIPQAQGAIAMYRIEGWFMFGITNQGGVAAGHKTLAECFEEQEFTLSFAPEISTIYFCPDFEGKQLGFINRVSQGIIQPDGYESFRKPAAGMAQYAIDKFCAVIGSLRGEIDEILLVGDRDEDKECALGAGIDFLWAEDWWRMDAN